MKMARVLGWALGLFLVIYANGAFGASVEIIGDLKISDYPDGGMAGVVFDDNTKQATAVPKVYDFNGQFLGILLIFDTYYKVYVPSIKAIAFFEMSGVIMVQTSIRLFYEGANCDTEPYVSYSYSPIVFQNSGKYYTGLKTEASGDIMVLSEKTHNNICVHNQEPSPTGPVVKAQELTLPFTLPAAYPFRFE